MANIDEKYYLNEDNSKVWGSIDMGNFYIDNNEELENEFLYNDSSMKI